MNQPNNKFYDAMKFTALIVLPALGTMYFGLAQIWGLPHANEVVGTIVVVDTFLGVVLQLQSNTYYKSGAQYDGALKVVAGRDNTTLQLALDTPPDQLLGQSNVNLKVRHEQPVAGFTDRLNEL